jgi:hypothetical protein
MIRKLVILFALTLSGFSSARKATFVPQSANKALLIRGGDRLDPAETAKLGTILAGTHAALTLMSQTRTAEVYGTTLTPLTQVLAQWQGTIVLSFCNLAWNLIVKGLDLRASMVKYCIPWVVMQYKTFWNEDHKKLGYPLGPQVVNAVLAPLTLYACVSDTSYVETLIKLSGIWSIANFLLMTLSPEASCDAYGIEASTENKASMKTLGFMCGGSGIFIALNAFSEMDPVQAFGYSWIPALLMQIDSNFISKTDHNKALSYAWLIVDAIMVLVCGVQVG